MMRIVDFLDNMDKRIIYLIVAIVVILPFLTPIGCPMKVTEPVRNIYNYVEDSIPEDGSILISIDYGPETMPELHPMGKALVTHAFSNNIRVFMLSLMPQGTGLAQDIIATTVREWNDDNPDNIKEVGKDITLFPFVPGVSAVILKMGEDIKGTFNTDAYGNDLDEVPIMSGVNNYSDIDYLVDLAGSSIILSWIIYANGRYDQKMAIGTTAVSMAEYYIYMNSGQANGMLGGLKGAAEYEQLLKLNEKSESRNEGLVGMDAQSSAHLTYIIFILLGNIIYFIKKKQEK
ncbi:MAG: hypothetical protein SVK54_06105 [candidate division WOR-3 bacterium]|nr:hypothetical protein [candidate division WOR-3 bacterium]